MDTGRQVIRWALPGWMAFIFWTIFMSVNTLVHGQNQSIYLEILKKVNELIIPLAAASIPLGFILYQLYYWVYWFGSIPFPVGNKFIEPLDRGKEILAGVKDSVDFKEIFDNPLKDTPPTALKKSGFIYYKSTEIMEKYRQNWHLSESAWYLALSDERYKNTAEFLEKRNQMLGDIYHSLGACYHALALAYGGYFIVFLYISYLEINTFLAGLTNLFSIAMILIIGKATILRFSSLLLNAAIFLAVFDMFKKGRIASFDALLVLKHDVITNVMLDRPTRLGVIAGNVTQHRTRRIRKTLK
jgi:hypothetical protein